MAAQKAFIHLDTSSRVARAFTSSEQEDFLWLETWWSTVKTLKWVEPCGPLLRGRLALTHTTVFGCCVKESLFCVVLESSDQPRRVNPWPLAYLILNNIPVLPEASTMGQQKYTRSMMDDEANPK